MRIKFSRCLRREIMAVRVVSTKRPQKESWRVLRLGVMYAICSSLSVLMPLTLVDMR